MGLRQVFTAGICVIALAGPVAAGEFKFTFDWTGLTLCTSGSPNRVSNPAFRVSGLPAGTTYVQFRLKDLDVPGYNHGGGGVKMSGDGTVPVGVFKYKSPCPPDGPHLYEWTAIAKTRKGGKTLGTARAQRTYP